MIPRDILELMQTGVVVSIATRNERLLPLSMAGMGVRALDGGKHLAIFIADKWSAPTLANARANGRVAVSFASPLTFKTAQIKGRFVDCRPLTDDELAYHREWKLRLQQEFLSAGDSRQAVMGLLLDATHTMIVQTQDVFVQTPGPRAGERVP